MKALACMIVSLAILSAHSQVKPEPLAFRQMLQPSVRGLEPTPFLTKLNGKRVMIEGYMAQLEDAPAGGFWLCPTPVFQDESGGGSGDLPPNAVFVVVRGAGSKPVAYLRGPLSITGTLKLNRESPRISLVLDSQAESKSKGTK
jgi:hypothetical protein